MSFASSNRTGLARVKEVTWGTTPASPALTPIRYTGETLDDGITTAKSKEIRSDRMVTDLILTDASISGDFNMELSYTSFDDFLESAFMSTWTAAVAIVGVAGDISTTATGLTSATAGKFTTAVVGTYVRLTGFTNPLNNTTYLVTANTGLTATLSPSPASIETPAGVLAHVTHGGMLRNGITEQSYTFVETFNDATTLTYRNFFGLRVKGFTFDLKTAAILTGKFSFIGKAASYTTTLFGGATFPAAPTTPVMNCVSNVQTILQNGAQIGAVGAVMSLSVNFDNQHRPQKGLGVLGNAGVVASQLSCQLTASQYFESKAQADLFKASTAFAFSFTLADSANNGYTFTFPNCKYDSFKVNSSQLDSDVTAATTFQALLDPVTVCMVQLVRFAGP